LSFVIRTLSFPHVVRCHRRAGLIGRDRGQSKGLLARIGVEQNLTLTIFSMEAARAVSDAASELNTRAHVHIKIDTGMSRLGVMPEDALDFARRFFNGRL